MRTRICPTCGCSLVRLGITNDEATVYRHEGEEKYFCCQGCVDLFVTDPRKYVEETRNLIVCPTCLAEKPPQSSAMLTWEGREIRFCRCPYCREEFQTDPKQYLDRLAGDVPFETVLRHS